jgi:hypothetical protein
MLTPFKAVYLWLAKVYESIQPKDVSKAFLWERLGAKTQNLIHSHMTNTTVNANPNRNVTLDAAGLALVKTIAEQLQLPEPDPEAKQPGEVFKEVLDSIEARLRRRLAATDSPVYKSLAERIEKLRNQAITNVQDSLAFLEQALQIARDVVAADRAAEEGTLHETARLFDSKRGALTQIVEENTPPGLHKIVPDIVDRIDTIVGQVAYTGWKESDSGDKKVRKELRAALKTFGLPAAAPAALTCPDPHEPDPASAPTTSSGPSSQPHTARIQRTRALSAPAPRPPGPDQRRLPPPRPSPLRPGGGPLELTNHGEITRPPTWNSGGHQPGHHMTAHPDLFMAIDTDEDEIEQS